MQEQQRAATQGEPVSARAIHKAHVRDRFVCLIAQGAAPLLVTAPPATADAAVARAGQGAFGPDIIWASSAS